MAVEQDSLFLPNTGAVDQLGALRTFLAGAKLRLTKTALPITPTTVEADMEAQEADYTGYPAGGVALTWSAVGMSSTGRATIASQRVRFQATGADPIAVANTIFNAWVATPGAAGPPVVAPVMEFGTVLAAPKPITNVSQYIDAVVYVTMDNDAVRGWIDVEN